MTYDKNPDSSGKTVSIKMLHTVPFIFAAILFLCCLTYEIILIEISSEIRGSIYDYFSVFIVLLSALLTTLYGQAYNLGWRRSIAFSVLCFALIFFGLSKAWKELDVLVLGNGSLAPFRAVLFLPLLAMVFSRCCKLDTLSLCDYLTPFFFYGHGVVTCACWVIGCCAGCPWPWGLLNPQTLRLVFPTQPCIIILGVAIAYWGLCYAKKHAYQAHGLVFANSLCIYGFFRFWLEFLSNNPRIIWKLSLFSIYALVLVAFGLVLRHIIKRKYK